MGTSYLPSHESACMYKACLYHPECMLRALELEPQDDPEDALRMLAESRHLNYDDESSYDSEMFPKSVILGPDDYGTVCEYCGEYIIDGEPADAVTVSYDIAEQWHTGQASALYALASTGRVQGYEHRDDCLMELARSPRSYIDSLDLDSICGYDQLVAELEAWPRELV